MFIFCRYLRGMSILKFAPVDLGRRNQNFVPSIHTFQPKVQISYHLFIFIHIFHSVVVLLFQLKYKGTIFLLSSKKPNVAFLWLTGSVSKAFVTRMNMGILVNVKVAYVRNKNCAVILVFCVCYRLALKESHCSFLYNKYCNIKVIIKPCLFYSSLPTCIISDLQNK